jgi:hypothetical protein
MSPRPVPIVQEVQTNLNAYDSSIGVFTLSSIMVEEM